MTRTKYTLIIANAVPLVLVATGGLDAAQLLILYWAETFIVCVFSVFKILFAEGVRDPEAKSPISGGETSRLPDLFPASAPPDGTLGILNSLLIAAVFSAKAGVALFVSGLTIFGWIVPKLPGADMKFCNAMGQLLMDRRLNPETDYSSMARPFLLPLTALFLHHAWSFIQDYMLSGESEIFNSRFYSERNLLRVLALFLIVIFGGFAAGLAGAHIYVILILILVKTVFEFHMLSADTRSTEEIRAS